MLAVSLVLVSLTAKALRWRTLMPGPRAPGVRAAVRIFFVSILVNNLLPFRLGEGVRVFSSPVARALSRRQAVSVLITERLIDAATLGACALVAVPLFAQSRTGSAGIMRAPGVDRWELGAVLAGGLGLVAGGTWLVRREDARLGAWGRWLALFVTDLIAVMRLDRGRAAAAGSLSILAWSGTFALHYALLRAIDIEGSFVLAVVVTLTTNLSMLVPATPSNVGITHAAAAAPLLAWGLPAEIAVAYAVLVHAVNTVPPTLIGLACAVVPSSTARSDGSR